MKENKFEVEKESIDSLFRMSSKFRSSHEFSKFFKFIERLNHYSRYNSMLVYLQNPSVEFYGGISFWKKRFDREVKESARPYVILTPNGPVMMVYDVFETEGAMSPLEFLENGVGFNQKEVKGKLKDSVLEKALEEIQKWGIKLSKKPLTYLNSGYVSASFGGNIEICLTSEMSTEEAFSVLLHEIAHLFLGHLGAHKLSYMGKKKTCLISSRKLSKETMELEAETICYLICKKLEIEPRSVEYLASYLSKDIILKEFCYETVIKTADKIEKYFVH